MCITSVDRDTRHSSYSEYLDFLAQRKKNKAEKQKVCGISLVSLHLFPQGNKRTPNGRKNRGRIISCQV